MKRALVDLRSLLWTGLLASKDVEFGRKVMFEEKEVHVNSAGHGYDNFTDHLLLVLAELKIMPRDVIMIDDGRNAKAMRQHMFADYKAGRDQAPEVTEQFNIAKEMVIKAWTGIGAQLVWQEAMEADDVGCYIAQELDGERWLVTNDGDWAYICDPDNNIHLYRSGMKDYNPYGPFDFKHIPIYKALVGDTSDGYKGARGFGEKAFLKLLEVFGYEGLEAFKVLIEKKRLADLAEDVSEMKELIKVIDGAEGVYTSYALAKMYPEKVNTMRRPLQWRAGMVSDISKCEDERLRKYHTQVRLIHASNYAEAKEWARKQIAISPYVTLDIETSTPPESDEWLMLQDKENGNVVDVFGSDLTGLGMTFGPNMQYTFYLTHDHVEETGVQNVRREDMRDFVDMVPREMMTIVHNAQFELPVLYCTWGEDWKDDPEYHGFLRNVRDTRILSSYADENRRAGLKNLSEVILGYTQVSYAQVTTRTFDADKVPAEGKEVRRYNDQLHGDEFVEVQFKMNELTAKHVLAYGADDCICTAALYNHLRVICEIEKTYGVFEEVETFPAYLTALAFAEGTDFSLESMRAMELEDDAKYDKAWVKLREYLIEKEWFGVICPQYEEITPAAVKEVFNILTGETLTTLVRKLERLAHELNGAADSMSDDDLADKVRLLATLVAANDVTSMNRLIKDNYDGEPVLDLASPKQMKSFLYDTIGLPIKIINNATDTEREKNPALAKAVMRFKQKSAGKDITMSDDEMQLLKAKAKTDDTAIAFGIAFDRDKLDDNEVEVLKAVGDMKTVMTRRSLFYKNYRNARHWKDGRIHASMNQCAAVTRRYSSSNPNLTQLPKRGEGVKFRGCFKPHHRDAVIVSEDYSGQELRLAAERSQDKNMLACYVGDNLKDIHSITAAGAMKLKWGSEVVSGLFEKYGDSANDDYALFLKVRKSADVGDHKMADDLRKAAKNVNFGAQNNAKAPKLAETLIMPLADAQLFLDARSSMFPDVEKASDAAAQKAKDVGYAETLMGARRHLQEGVMSSDRGNIERAARQAWNFEIQSSASEMTKLGMKRIWTSGIPWKYDFRFIAPIHDEVVFSVHKDHAVDCVRDVHDCMVVPYATMKVPILASISLGKNFADQIECGDWFIEENVKGALNDIFSDKAAA